MLKRYKFDVILIGILFVLGLFFMLIWLLSFKDQKGTKAYVYRDSIEIKIIDLTKNGEYEIEGAISPMKIVVHNGFIEVTESGCKNQICVNHYEICNIGSSIICIPNKVEIRIEKRE